MIPSSMQALSLGFSCVWFFLALARVQTQGPNWTEAPFPALLAFGDSILDTGNNNLLPTVAKSNFPPYGKDFIGHEPTGRFSNGKVPSDLLASKLGIKELLPAYLSPKLSSEDLLTGVCFASGSSGYDPLTSEIMSVLSIQDQLELFKDYNEKLQAVTDPGTAASIIRESLYLVCSGSNDIANTYFGTQLRKEDYNISAYTSFLVNSASTFVEELYYLGARKIAVVGLPPIGCLPSQRVRIVGGIQRECAPLFNHVSEMYNNKLSMKVQMLQKKLVGANIVYADMYRKFLHLIQQSSEYGFEESMKGCCGSGEFEVGGLCNGKSVVCSDDSKYVFWDGFHPTERTYSILVDEIAQQVLPPLSSM